LQSKLQLNGYYSTFYYSQVKMTEIYLKTCMQKLDEEQNFTYSIVFFSAGGANKYKTIL